MAITPLNTVQAIAMSENNHELQNNHGQQLIETYYSQKSLFYAAMHNIRHPLILEKSRKLYVMLENIPFSDINEEDLIYINKMMEVTRRLLLSNPGKERLDLLLLHQNLILIAPGYFLSPQARYFLVNFAKIELALSAAIFIMTMILFASGSSMTVLGLGLFGLYAVSGLAHYACGRNNARDQDFQALNDCMMGNKDLNKGFVPPS